MKTTALRRWTAVCLSVLTAAAIISASADQQTTAGKHSKSYTGKVKAVDPKEHMLGVKDFMLGKTFNLGDSCDYVFLKGAGTISDLRPGQKVTVYYQNVHGVLVANRVEQQPLRYDGTVKAIDSASRTLTLDHGAMNKTFLIAEDCSVMLRGNKSGTLAAVKPGHRVSVIYETPNGTRTAREISQTSATFVGKLTAIDLSARTLKAKHVFGTKKFNLAEDCKIMLTARPEAQLRDLRMGDSLAFNYDVVNGVNVVSRIVQTEEMAETPTAGISP
jgi:Cu/Ag efflux protein CusF